MALKKMLGENYSPLYFLASLGAGGLSISFYMYLMFMVKHPKTPMATFEDIFAAFGGGIVPAVLIGGSLIAIVIFSFLHFRLLAWNFNEYKLFKQTQAFEKLKSSNAEVALMAIPLTLAMTVNVCFVLGAIFVPNLWSIVEFLFPFAIAAFWAVGVYALRIFVDYFSRIMTGGFDFVNNNNLSQMIAIFAFSMVSVGFAAPGAMSHYIGISAIGLFSSIFFGCIALFLMLIKLTLGFKSILMYGISKEASASLWIMIPILTLLGIALIRLTFGLVHNFNQPASPSGLFLLTSSIVSIQIITGIIGYFVMKKVGYFEDYVYGDKNSAGSLALVCPGVAFFVFGMFFITFGLVQNKIFESFSIPYFIILAPFVFIQYKTIDVYFRLYKKLISN